METETRRCLADFRSGRVGAFDNLCRRYEPLMQSSERSFLQTHPDFDAAEVRQEITLAVYAAAQSYDLSAQDVTFGLYARVCIRNRLYWLARHTARKIRRGGGRLHGPKKRDAQQDASFEAALIRVLDELTRG